MHSVTLRTPDNVVGAAFCLASCSTSGSATVQDPSQVGRKVGGGNYKLLLTIAVLAVVSTLYIGLKAGPTVVLVMVTCIVMLLFASILARWVMNKDEGTADMQEVSQSEPCVRLWLFASTCSAT